MRNYFTRPAWMRRSPRVPGGVPDENRLPINRGDIELSLMYRIYVPDAEKMKTWKMAQSEIIR